MLKKSLLLKHGAYNIKSVKKSSAGSTKKSKINFPKKNSETQKKKQQRETFTENEDKFSAEVKQFENMFQINAKTVKKALDGILSLTVENPKLKNRLFEEQFPVYIQINTIKVPNINTKILRLPLKHSILSGDSEVCLIVPDVKGIPNKNHEEHLEHYENLLNRKNVTNIKKIMTFHEFRTEYETFEMRRRLVDLYDTFLVDGRISGKTVKKCGKIFYTKRKVPTSVKLQASKLKEHIEQTLKKTALYLHGKGDSFMVQIGHNMMDKTEIVENLFCVLEQLNKQFPGGFNNVRSLNLATFTGITVPVYISLKNQNEVDTPTQARRQYVIETVTGEISTKNNLGVVVKPTGEVISYELEKKGSQKDQGGKKLIQSQKKDRAGNKRKLEAITNNSEDIKKIKRKKKIKFNKL